MSSDLDTISEVSFDCDAARATLRQTFEIGIMFADSAIA
jgi:hypothetical protein